MNNTEYLAQALTMNPLEESDAILALRAEHLGLQPKAASLGEQSWQREQRREQLAKRINQLRYHFWSLPIQQLRAELDHADVSGLPELQPAVDRLRIVSFCRADFPRLAQHPKTQLDLFNLLKHVAVLPPRTASTVKENFLRSVKTAGQLNDCRRMIRMMKREFPQLYQLESDWLTQLDHRKSVRGLSPNQQQVGGGSSFDFGVPGWVIVVVILFILRFLAALVR